MSKEPTTIPCAVGQVLDEDVLDFDNVSKKIHYPLPEDLRKTVTMRYDLHIWKPGYPWLYSSSMNSMRGKLFKEVQQIVTAGGGAWRVVNPQTATVVACGPAERLTDPERKDKDDSSS